MPLCELAQLRSILSVRVRLYESMKRVQLWIQVKIYWSMVKSIQNKNIQIDQRKENKVEKKIRMAKLKWLQVLRKSGILKMHGLEFEPWNCSRETKKNPISTKF